MTTYSDSIPEVDQSYIDMIVSAKGFDSLTETQEEAFEAGVLDDDNSLLIAETGNGKTMCAEVFLYKNLGSNSSAYIVPSRQLVTEKIEQFSEWVPDRVSVGESYSDDIIVKTFESFYWSFVRSSGVDASYDAIVFDDFHEMYSSNRGVEIEKALTMAKQTNANLLGMSATIGNPHEIAEWMDADCIISESRRGVPVEEHPVEIDEVTFGSRGEQIANVISENTEKAPFLVFVYQRSWTESRAEEIADTHDFSDTQTDFVSEIGSVIDTKLTDTYRTLGECMNNGVAFHHSGLAQPVRELIVSAVHEGTVSCVCSTTGLAYGFDAPIQSVIVADMKRYDGFMGVHEYVQMIGRAGRTGYGYEKGYAFPMWKDSVAKSTYQFDTVAQDKKLEPIESHIESPELKWFILELIANGWTTDDTLTSVLEETYYVHEMTTKRLLNHDIQQATRWLKNSGLIESPARDSYHSTAFGDSAIEFNHASFTNIDPESVVKIRNELLSIETPHPEDIVQLLADTFWFCELRTEATPSDQTLEKKLLEHDYANCEEVGVICWEWCEGATVADLEATYNINATTIPRLANEIATYVRAIGNLLEMDPQLTKPDWIDTFASQCEYGVPVKDVDLLEQTYGVGKQTYANVVSYITKITRQNDVSVESTADGIEWLMNDTSVEVAKDYLMRKVDGVGPKTAQKLITYVQSTEKRTVPTVPYAHMDIDSESIQRTSPASSTVSDSDSTQETTDDSDSDDGSQTSLDGFTPASEV